MNTMHELEAMLAEQRAAEAAFEALDINEESANPAIYAAAEERIGRAIDAMRAARPDDPAAMAVWLCWATHRDDGGDIDIRHGAGMAHIADQLERLAGRVQA